MSCSVPQGKLWISECLNKLVCFFHMSLFLLCCSLPSLYIFLLFHFLYIINNLVSGATGHNLLSHFHFHKKKLSSLQWKAGRLKYHRYIPYIYVLAPESLDKVVVIQASPAEGTSSPPCLAPSWGQWVELMEQRDREWGHPSSVGLGSVGHSSTILTSVSVLKAHMVTQKSRNNHRVP